MINIATYDRKVVDITNLKPGDLSLTHVANSLSQIGRFSGALEQFYSVAEHSVLVSKIVRNLMLSAGTTFVDVHEVDAVAIYALLHEVGEAYGVGDIAWSIKKSGVADKLKDVEMLVMSAVIAGLQRRGARYHAFRPNNLKLVNCVDSAAALIEADTFNPWLRSTMEAEATPDALVLERAIRAAEHTDLPIGLSHREARDLFMEWYHELKWWG